MKFVYCFLTNRWRGFAIRAGSKEKIKYIHQNPVKEKIVTEPENYYFSSARNYADLESALEIEVVFMGWDNHTGFDRLVMFI